MTKKEIKLRLELLKNDILKENYKILYGNKKNKEKKIKKMLK